MSIGVFDSGLGGLCAVEKLSALCPEMDIVYFGDTARLPYGTRSADAVRRYAAQDAAFLVEKGVNAILIACGTASSAALPELAASVPVPILGVVEPAAREAINLSENKKIGVLGTQATIASRSYEKAIRALCPEAEIVPVACPLLVPLVENGETGGKLVELSLSRYLEAPMAAGCDTLLLGCTHYPLLSDAILSLCPDVKLADAGRAGAGAMARLAAERGFAHGEGRVELYTSDFSQGFDTLARRFLNREDVRFSDEKVAVETWN